MGNQSNLHRKQREGEQMAKKVTVTLIDDFDGEAAADETVEFGLDGVTYEIDLSTKNAAKLRNEMSKWVEAGRRVGGRRRGRSGSARSRGRWTASRVRRLGNGLVVTGTTCQPAAGYPPTSSRLSTRRTSGEPGVGPDQPLPAGFDCPARPGSNRPAPT